MGKYVTYLLRGQEETCILQTVHVRDCTIQDKVFFREKRTGQKDGILRSAHSNVFTIFGGKHIMGTMRRVAWLLGITALVLLILLPVSACAAENYPIEDNGKWAGNVTNVKGIFDADPDFDLDFSSGDKLWGIIPIPDLKMSLTSHFCRKRPFRQAAGSLFPIRPARLHPFHIFSSATLSIGRRIPLGIPVEAS